MKGRSYKILIFAPIFPRIGGPEAYVNGKLAIAFLNAGWEVNVISMNENGASFQRDNSTIWGPLKNITYSAHSGPNEIDYRLKMLIWSTNAYRLASKLMRRKKYDLILSRCQPIWAHLPALLISGKKGLNWVANWNDPAPIRKYPPPLGNGPTTKIGSPLEFIFRRICLKASWHTFPCERLLRYMHSYMPKGMHLKSSVVPHVALHDLFNNGHKKSSKFSLCHAGSLYLRNWRQFLEGVKEFAMRREIGSSFCVKFLGWAPDGLGGTIRHLELQDVVSIEDAKSYEDSLKLMKNEEVLVLLEHTCEEGIFLPSKLIDYVQTGRPILAVSPKIGTVPDLIERFGGGISVDCDSPNDIATALGVLYERWKKSTLDEDFSTRELSNMFSEESVVTRYEAIFRQIGA